jgi:hypothetical protein
MDREESGRGDDEQETRRRRWQQIAPRQRPDSKLRGAVPSTPRSVGVGWPPASLRRAGGPFD